MPRDSEKIFFSFATGVCVLISALVIVSLNGCGGGGREAARFDPAAVQQTTAQQVDSGLTPSATTTVSLCDNSTGVSISWHAENHGDGALLDLDYHGYNLLRQIEVRGIATGETVIVKPFGAATSSFTSTDTTLVATSISPYDGYTLSSVTLQGATDTNDIPYYRAWIFFPPWAESSPLPDRRDFYPEVTWSGGSYTACRPAEILSIGAQHCYGLTFWDDDCQPATPTTQVTPATGTTSTLYTVNCVPGTGTYYAVEVRCDTALAWTEVWEGNSVQCRYSEAGTYTPACRFDHAREDDSEEEDEGQEVVHRRPRGIRRAVCRVPPAQRDVRALATFFRTLRAW